EAESALGDARGPLAAEVRGLVAYAKGEFDRGLEVIAAALATPEEAMAIARLEATRGMLEHARGRADRSVEAFTTAVDPATREGALVEEATYLTGVAAAGVDSGATARALAAATRAAVLWERLGQP